MGRCLSKRSVHSNQFTLTFPVLFKASAYPTPLRERNFSSLSVRSRSYSSAPIIVLTEGDCGWYLSEGLLGKFLNGHIRSSPNPADERVVRRNSLDFFTSLGAPANRV